MPERSYHEWQFGAGVGEQLSQMLGERLYGDLAGGEVNAAVEAIGRRELAFMLSGAESTRDRAYKSARDKVRRWQRGTQRPSTTGRAAMQAVARQWRHQQLRQRSALRISMVADVTVSAKPWRRGKVDATLSGSDLRDFVDALDRDDAIEAAQIAFDAYGLDPDNVTSIDALYSLDIT